MSDARFYYRRSIELRAGVKVWVVYAVTPVAGEKPDPVPVVAGFPENWRPSGELGMCLYVQDAPAAIVETVIPRDRFRRHFERISEAEALALYPELAQVFQPIQPTKIHNDPAESARVSDRP